MPYLQRAATALVLLRGLSEADAATLLGIARSTMRKLMERGHAELQAELIGAGYGPDVSSAGTRVELRELAQAA